jgi:uncharacterized membrane protein YqhA
MQAVLALCKYARDGCVACMLRFLLPLRFLMLLASLGALSGAALMFWLAGAKLGDGVQLLWASGAGPAGEVTAAVMGATDAFLFGIVLIIFAYAIAFGFVFQAQEQTREKVPAWLQVHGVSELKQILIEVVIVYLIVDFATDLAADGDVLTWQTLVKPASIVLIATALRLMARPHARGPIPFNEHP